ncbi:uncharacterized protein LOC129587473 [Paramacrobiotus metropolitanus]|uniref:uncharacterized protein LOC129587473 n=1 Tax=Paramacrobiotus metropolitanus TaxID=2943436 RepID=UPI002445D029|nr:uncharacterized protein LOC129587473 [Paramacrobiotus metropolitanus]
MFSQKHDYFSVETEGPDGLFCEGTVIDVDDFGVLLIDQHIPNTPPVWTPYWQAFQRHNYAEELWALLSHKQLSLPTSVLVKTQLSNDRPWVWLPGELLAFYFIAVVKIDVFGEKIHVVPYDHVCLASQMRNLVMPNFHYIKMCFDLPQLFSFCTTEEFIALWNRHFPMDSFKKGKAVAFVDNRVVCLGNNDWIRNIKEILWTSDDGPDRLIESLMCTYQRNKEPTPPASPGVLLERNPAFLDVKAEPNFMRTHHLTTL